MIAAFLAICFALLAIYSIRKEPRQFRNCIFIMFSLLFLFYFIAQTSQHINYLYILILILIYVGIPMTLLIISMFLIYDGFLMFKKEGVSLPNSLSLITGVIIFTFLIFLGFIFLSEVTTVFLSSAIFTILVMLYIFFTFSGFFIYSFIYSFLPKGKECDFILIHGAGLLDGYRVSPLLKKRLDKGIQVFELGQRKALFIVSGGKGEDETISEAEAMKNYLLTQGMAKSAIIIEDTSVSTYQNIIFSKRLMDERKTIYKCIFITNDYHVFRTAMYARKVKLNAQGIGCKTALYYWPSAFIREYIAVIFHFKWAFISWVLLSAIFILL